MFSRKIKDTGLIFFFDLDEKVPLHMFFVFYPIDVLFLNLNHEVVDKKESFKPFTFYTTKEKCRYIIELPDKSTEETKLGDKIFF